MWDSSRDLFSNFLSEFLENFSFCLHTSVVVKTFLMHCYTTESMVVTYVSHSRGHLILFQICLSIKFLNFLGGFFKKMFNCVSVELITQYNELTQISLRVLKKKQRKRKKKKKKRNIGIRGLKDDLIGCSR